ncbi:MAG: hypothetical protein ACT4QE_01180 [Anaerolineales bacterium]
MLRRSLFAHLPALNLARLLPFRKTAPLTGGDARLRFQFASAGQLLHSTDRGRTWAEALTLEPGYKSLQLWQHGVETHLRLEYGDHCVEMLSTDGAHWQTL